MLAIQGIVKIAGGVQVSLNTSPQRFYTLYRSADLGAASPWTAVQGPVVGTDGILTFQDSGAGTRSFYRVTATLP